MGMAFKATAMDLTAGDLQGSKKTGGAMAHVIMSHAGWHTGPQRQQRLCAVKCLNLRFFVDAQHDRRSGGST
jgi:hypothetical protein